MTVIEVNGYFLTPEESGIVPITKSLSSLKDISKRSGSFTKTLLIPGTKDANQFFAHYYQVNLNSGAFNHKAKTQAIIRENGIVVFEGDMQLYAVNNTAKSADGFQQNIRYEVVIRDEVALFFNEMADKKLTDLSFGSFNHIYTAENIVSSWANTWEDGYKYVMPWADDNIYGLQEFKPAIYARQYWDRIFEENGYRYDWPDMDVDSIRFSKLLMPYVGDEVKPTQEDVDLTRAQYFAYAYNGPTLTVAANTQTQFPTIYAFETDQLIYDQEPHFNTTTFKYETPNWGGPGALAVDFKIKFKVKIENLTASQIWLRSVDPSTGQLKLGPDVNLFSGTNGGQTQGAGGNLQYKMNYRLLKNGSLASNNDLIYDNVNQAELRTGANASTIAANGTMTLIDGYYDTTKLNSTAFTVGDLYQLAYGLRWNQTVLSIVAHAPRWAKVSPGTTITGSPSAQTASTRIYMEIEYMEVQFRSIVNQIGFGSIVNMQRMITDMKQRDFIKGILTHFNLYTDIDPDDEKKIVVRRRDEYYDSGKVVDWTKKLVKGLDSRLQFVQEDAGANMLFTYTAGKDVVNQGYLANVGETYGQLNYIFGDKYAKGTQTIQVPWEPSPILLTDFGAHVNSFNGFAPKCGPRLIYDAGMRDCGNFGIQNYSGNIVYSTEYPFTGHFDNPVTPTWDLNFGVCSYYFYQNYQSITLNNSYTLHYDRTVQQLEDGKTLTAYFNLDANDIETIELNDKIFINDAYFNIVEITDYDANSTRPTKVKLITIDEKTKLGRFSRNTKPTFTGTGILTPTGPGKPTGPGNTGVTTPIRELSKTRNTSTNILVQPGDGINIGKNNYINGKENVVVGDNNVITSDQVIILGSNVTADKPGIWLENAYMDPNGNITYTGITVVDGGEDTVLPFDKTNIADVIDSGEDVVRRFGGVNTTTVIRQTPEDS
jgi:hypothetical protein